MEIVSKRHPYKFYLVLIVISLFFLGVGSVFISASIRDNNDFGYIMFLAFLALTVYMNWVFIKHSSKIVLNKIGIHYRNKFYKWDDIENIKLTGKSGLFLGTPTECATLIFKNSKPVLIFDSFYSNISEIKYFIQEIVINKKSTVTYENKKMDLKDFDRELFIPYKGSAVFSFRGLLMWGLIAFLLLMPFYIKRKIEWNPSFLFLIGFSLFWFLLNSWMMHYFEISKKYFVIKNPFFFWIKKIYHIDDIHEIVYEQQGKQPNSLRIITTDFKSKLFLAGSLNDKTWLEMKKELESKNIVVRNECI